MLHNAALMGRCFRPAECGAALEQVSWTRAFLLLSNSKGTVGGRDYQRSCPHSEAALYFRRDNSWIDLLDDKL